MNRFPGLAVRQNGVPSNDGCHPEKTIEILRSPSNLTSHPYANWSPRNATASTTEIKGVHYRSQAVELQGCFGDRT